MALGGPTERLLYTNKPPYVGSGPYTAVEWKKGSYVHLVRNPTWWGPKPKIDEIYFEYYTNNDTLLQDLKSGTIDGGTDLTATQMKQLQSEPGITARAVKVDEFEDLGFNCYSGPSKGNPVLRDWKFRQALNWAVDLDKIASLVWGGTATPGTTIIPPNYYHDPDWHWEPPAGVKYTYDPAIANQKLDEAGYKDTNGDGVREYKGKPIELGLIAREESLQSQTTGKLIVGWFKDVGITVKLEVMDEATLGEKELNYDGSVFKPDFDMMLWGWYLDYDPGSMLSYLTKGQIENWNETCWWNPEYEKLYVQQSQELDAAKRKPIIDRMQQILYEQTPYIVTDYGPDFEAYNTAKWEGYIQIPNPNGNTILPPFGNGGYANFLSIGPKTTAPLLFERDLGEVLHDDVGTVLAESFRLTETVDADDEAEAAAATGLHTGEGVLDDDRPRGRHPQTPRGLEVHRRVGLPRQAQLLAGHAVDADLEEVCESRNVEDHGRVLARRHQPHTHACFAQAVDELHGGRIRPDPAFSHLGAEEHVLAVAEAADGLQLGRVGGPTPGQLDASRGEEVADAVVARLAVDVEAVVGLLVERPELLATVSGARPEVRVEQRLPSRGVHDRGLCHDAVEVEHDGVVPGARDGCRRGVHVPPRGSECGPAP